MRKINLLSLATMVLLLQVTIFAQAYNESKDFSYALKLYNENFYDVAAQQFDSFIDRYPSSERIPEARFYHGSSLYESKDYSNARIAFQTLAVTFPDHQRAPEAWRKVGESYRELGKKEEAAKALETVKILYPSSSFAPEALLAAADLFSQIGQLNKAEQICRDFLDRYLESSEYPRGRLLFGEVLYAKGQLEQADVEFQRALDVADNEQTRAAATLGRARIYQQLGLFDKAEANYRSVIQKVPGSAVAYQAFESLASALLERRQWQSALSLLTQNKQEFGKDERLNLLSLEIQALFRTANYVQARDKSEQLLTALPDRDARQSAPRFYLASAAMEQGLTARALENLKFLVDPSNDFIIQEYRTAAVFNLAALYLRQNEIAPARQYLSRYQSETSADANGEMLHQRLIRTALRQNQLAAAIDELQRFRGTYPESIYRDDLIFELGRAYFLNGQYERSLISFEQIRESYAGSNYADSSKTFIRFINDHYRNDQRAGISRMAGLMAKMLTGSERRELLFDLGKIYLNDLQDYQQATSIFEKYLENASDSSTKGAGYYYLSQSQLRLAQYDRFTGQMDTRSNEIATASIRQAMNFVKYAPAPDSMTFIFLDEALPNDIRGSEKEARLWELFLQNYANSPLNVDGLVALADLQKRRGNIDVAIGLYDRAMANQQRPDIAGEAAWQKALLQESAGKPGAANETLKSLMLNYPNHPRNVAAHLTLARQSAMMSDYRTAAAFLQRLVDNYNYANQLPEVRRQLTDYFIASGQIEQAQSYISAQLAVTNHPQDAVIRYYLPPPPGSLNFYAGKAAYNQQNYRQARSYLLKYLNSGEGGHLQNEAFYLMGLIALEKPDKQSALLHFSLVDTAIDTTYFYRATETAANLLFQERQYEQTLTRIYSLLPIATETSKKMQHEAMKIRCQIHLGQNQAAQSGIQQFSRTYGKTEGAEEHLAAFEWEQGRVNLASKQFDAAIKNFKKVTGKFKKTDFADDAQLSIARTYATLNKSKDALKATEELFKKFPNSELRGDAHLLNAEVYFRNERPEEGMAAVKAAVDVAKTPDARKRALGMLIITYRNTGAWDNALQMSRAYIQEFPDAEDLISQKINLGIAMTNLGRTTEAVEYLRALKYEVDSEVEPEIQYYIGEALYNGSQYDEAIKEFLKIPLLSRKTKLQWEASALYKAGQAYERLGRKSDAIRMYQEIVDRPGIQMQLKSEAQKLITALKTG